MNIEIKLTICLLFLIAMLLSPTMISAHGAKIEYTIATSIEIVAKYDSGEPMAEAQVTIYAPDNPSTPWLTGTCDEEGRFTFAPDKSILGSWAIQVRQASHGDMIHIEIAEGAVTGGSSSDYSTLQIIIMSVCVTWGIIGTALYFHRRKA